ncbi:MAG: FliH/SctL family protein [Pseudomonadota bacterium]|jgi:flagellar biosynthesis/type III secretory pathway protein FliH
MAPQRSDVAGTVTVETYRPSEYQEQEWEVISDAHEDAQFVPASFSTVQAAAYEVDAMFSDFGTPTKTAIELSREAGDFEFEFSQGIQDAELADEGTAKANIIVHDGVDGDLQVNRDDNPDIGTSSLSETQCATNEVIDESAVLVADDTTSSEQQTAPSGDADLKEALQQSYERGRLEARAEQAEFQRQLEERYQLLWEDMQVQLDETQRTNEVRAVELALQVAKRMVGDVVEHQREYIYQVTREAIKAAAGAAISAVRVSPQDYEFLKLSEYGDSKKIVAGEPLSFVSDDSIRAGCVLVTASGEVDFDLYKAWERIRSKVVQEPES